MNLVELTQYTTNEEKAEEYLREQGILKTFQECPQCQGTRINRVRRTKYKCYSCNREWGVRRDSILEGLRVPFTKFLRSNPENIGAVPVTIGIRDCFSCRDRNLGNLFDRDDQKVSVLIEKECLVNPLGF